MVFVSILLSVITLAIVSQATPDTPVGEKEDQTSDTSQQSYSTTNTTSTNTTSITQDETEIQFTEEKAETVGDQAAVDGGWVIDGNIDIQTILLTSTQFIIIAILFFALIILNYLFLYNGGDFRVYLNQAFQLAGFPAIAQMIGKSWKIDETISINIRGLLNPLITIFLPLHSSAMDYGLSIEGDHAVVSCSVEMLPLKMQLIRLYLNQI